MILGEDPELELKGMSKPEGTMIKATAPFPQGLHPLSGAEMNTSYLSRACAYQ